MKLKMILALSVALSAMRYVSLAADTVPAAPVKSYQIRNSKFDQLLRPENANNADGTRIVLYPAEPWKCMTWKLCPAGDSAFQLQNHFTNKTFENKTNDAPSAVVQVPFARDPSKRPTWNVIK